MDPSTPFLEARGLTKYFDHIQAVDHVDLQCSAKDALILLGANGAGKTTLLKLLSRLLKPTSGSILLKGKTITSSTEIDYKSTLGYSGHTLHLYQDLTVEENLIFFSRLYPIKNGRERMIEILENFDLTDIRETPVRNLSRGMQQRADLGRAFLHRPFLLFLDEPLAHLDLKSSHLIIQNIQKFLSQEGILILSTHQIDCVKSFANRWIILDQGKIVHQQDSTGSQSIQEFYQKFSENSR